MQMRNIQQVAGNPRLGRFTIESQRERRLEIQREQRVSRGSARHVFLV